MKIYKLKSHAKINLTLNIIGKFRNNLHRIESIISFIQLYDEIKISERKSKKHIVSFNGRFSRGISKKNSVIKVLNLLDKNNFLKGKKYFIRIKKNIPQKSGMGGGSMNAASILSFFLKKKIINFYFAKKFAKKIGFDVILGLNNKTKILYSDNSIKEVNKKIAFHLILVKPNFGNSTKKVYSKNKTFSKQQYHRNKNLRISEKLIFQSKNDLENSAFKINPKLNALKNSILSLKKGMFARMTGSGSTIVIYFNSRALAKNAFNIYKRKLNKNWCILSKII